MKKILRIIPFALIGSIYSMSSSANDFNNNQQISSGKRHTCSLKMGEVFCWGDNINHQLGSLGNDSNIPKKVPNIIDAIYLSSGGQHSCVVKKNGNVQCWGLKTLGLKGEVKVQIKKINSISLKEMVKFNNIIIINLFVSNLAKNILC